MASMKENWVVGLHHNWHDHSLLYNPLFDFHMAGEEDLKEVNGREIPLIPMDACNFVPECFQPSSTARFWDILYIARAVYFKKIPDFFDCVRELYDRGHRHRILFLCPVPPYRWSERKTVFYNIHKVYDRMFSEEEKDRFTLLTLNYRYPFPFDLETLAYFYRSSRIFVHFADDERRCRVAAYAWCSGIPVVGMACIGSLLPPPLRREPFFFEVRDMGRFHERIEEALSSVRTPSLNFDEVRNCLGERSTKAVFRDHLKRLFERRQLEFEDGYLLLSNLDRRLGRHMNFGNDRNVVPLSMEDFLSILKEGEERLGALRNCQDPEMEAAKWSRSSERSSI